MITLYAYHACSTCRSAIKFLEARGVRFVARAIVETPPSVVELRRMLTYLRADGLDLKNLFNTSGQSYRAANLAERFARGLSDEDAFALLAADGKLIKRPFVLLDDGGTVGFRADRWGELLERKTR